jgi:hypothetical protein
MPFPSWGRHTTVVTLVLATLGAGIQSTPAWGADEQPTWSAAARQIQNYALTDLELTLRLRTALEQDDKLVDQNVGASVKDRVATLWGSVGSSQLSRHAAEVAQKTLGVMSVINQLRINRPAESSLPRSAATYNPLTEPMLSEAPRAQAAVVHRADERALITGQGLFWKPVGVPAAPPKIADYTTSGADPSFGQPAPRAGEPVWRPGTTPPGPDPVGAPPAVSSTQAPPPAIARLAAPDKPAENQNDLRARVEALRLGDSRYLGLRAEVRGETVQISGHAEAWTQVFELCRRVAWLPGVKRIVVEAIHIED